MSFDASVDYDGFDTTKQKIHLLDFAIESFLTLEELVALAERIVQLADPNVAFRTGFMKSTMFIDVDQSNLRVKVGFRSGYSKFVELGTTRIRAHPSLVPALFVALNEFKEQYPEKIKRFAKINVRK